MLSAMCIESSAFLQRRNNRLMASAPSMVDQLASASKRGVLWVAIAHYLRAQFQREPDFGVASVNYDFSELLQRAGEPS